MSLSTRCKCCGEWLIREEIEDREFMETAQGILGGPLCFECFIDACSREEGTVRTRQ